MAGLDEEEQSVVFVFYSLHKFSFLSLSSLFSPKPTSLLLPLLRRLLLLRRRSSSPVLIIYVCPRRPLRRRREAARQQHPGQQAGADPRGVLVGRDRQVVGQVGVAREGRGRVAVHADGPLEAGGVRVARADVLGLKDCFFGG